MAGKMARLHIPGVGESVIQVDGGTPYEQDTLQKYPLGTILQLGLQKYAYAKAYGTQNPDVASHLGCHQHMAYTTVAASAAAGVSTITADFGSGDGAASDGVLAANELVGGFIVVFPHSSNTFIRQIIGNTAVASGGGEVTITLDSPTPAAVVADVSHCEAMASPFLNVVSGNYPTRPCVGIPTYPATTGKYFWLLVEGISWVSPQAEVGVNDHNMEIVFRHDGSVDEADYSDAYTTKQQHAGFVLTRAAAGTQGAPFMKFKIF